MPWRSALAAASSALLVAGCGGSGAQHRTQPKPKIPAHVAQTLAADADAVSSKQGCAARGSAAKLRTDVLSTYTRIPQRYREQLLSAANDLVARIPECLPPKTDNGKHKDHGTHKGRKKHGKPDEND
jgi:outer membrane murein-binding lipoprotein Lpp